MYRRTGRGRLLLLVFLGLCIVLITLDFRQGEGGALDKAREISSAVVEPIQRGFTKVFRPVGDFFSSVGELGSLRAENARLKAELETIENQISEAETIAEENSHLRELFELDESWVSMDKVTAEVINKVPSNYRWIVEINKGSDDGVRPDMAVITADGLAGKVTRVDGNSSTVVTLVDPTAGAASAKIVGAGFIASVSGNGVGEPLSLELVDPDIDVNVDDEVVTSSYNGGIYPPNIPIGRVSFVNANTAALEQDIDVEPYVDFQSIDFVQVLLESGPKLETPAEQTRTNRR
jgi:rod shape-determining protein MreC